MFQSESISVKLKVWWFTETEMVESTAFCLYREFTQIKVHRFK